VSLSFKHDATKIAPPTLERISGSLENKTMKGSEMQTPLEVEGLLVDPQPLPLAANEEFAGRSQPSSGWDPFEVWRTRVRAAQAPVESGAVIA
jgi:hypothetical protein